MSQNTDELWESLVKEKFPNFSKHQLDEAKIIGSISWLCGDETVMSEIYSKYVMMKRLTGIEPNKG